MLNTAKLAGTHYSSHESTTDWTTQTLVPKTLNTTKFIYIKFIVDSVISNLYNQISKRNYTIPQMH